MLGGDYANGVKGVGIVNAMEILQAFHFPHAPCDDAVVSLKRFATWLDISVKDRTDDEYSKRFAARHRSARSRWEAPPSFPSRQAVDEYLGPKVASTEDLARQRGVAMEAWDPDASTQKIFAWREPDEASLRKRCALELGWSDGTIDAVISPVFDARQREGRAGFFQSVPATL